MKYVKASDGILKELFLDVCGRWCESLMEEMNKVLLRGVVTLKVHER